MNPCTKTNPIMYSFYINNVSNPTPFSSKISQFQIHKKHTHTSIVGLKMAFEQAYQSVTDETHLDGTSLDVSTLSAQDVDQ